MLTKTVVCGRLEATFCSLGASLSSLKFDGIELLSTFSSVEDFLPIESGYHGRIIAPIPGRREKPILLDGKPLAVMPNEGSVLAHGNTLGPSFKECPFEIVETEEETRVEFEFPLDIGKRIGKVVYALSRNEPRLEVRMSAPSLPKGPFSMAFHPYFCLGETSCLNLWLKFDSDKVATYDSRLVPQNYEKPAKWQDFSKGKLLGDAIKEGEAGGANGLDHCFHVLGRIELSGPKARMSIELSTGFAQLYSENFPAKGPLSLGQGHPKYAGIAIEPISDLVAASKSVEAREDEPYQNVSVFRFERA